MARCHELIKVISMRQMLRKHGFTVYLIDEFQSSSTYSECKDELEMFHYVDNLRPWRRRVTGDEQVKCHGFLKCKNERRMDGVSGIKSESARIRYWNRDVAAVCKFCYILYGLHKNGKTPQCFSVHKLTNGEEASDQKQK
ncbi:hypothetical protein GGI25_004953 [Coemansia spiralis]|uniref:Uncharacterized protein n=2 Tax=Coemansia TaxID=4863 RepID=A0A9W8G539_9FUNG|nr:hypothetical protein EDC05_004942 [Coemansia umbellata]KAJ2620328.1 hypothetical protein GGI26_005095 [Coemansia sp. RSA 1358]KAJ2672803.1 hypothetical protein GGI25_004953 [Coemansia spiralis]